MRTIAKIGRIGSSGLRFINTRPYSTIKFPQIEQEVQKQPQLNQFKHPLFHTFLIASTTYMILHAISYKLDYDEEKLKIEAKEKEIESEIQNIIDKKNKEYSNSKRWYRRILW